MDLFRCYYSVKIQCWWWSSSYSCSSSSSCRHSSLNKQNNVLNYLRAPISCPRRRFRYSLLLLSSSSSSSWNCRQPERAISLVANHTNWRHREPRNELAACETRAQANPAQGKWSFVSHIPLYCNCSTRLSPARVPACLQSTIIQSNFVARTIRSIFISAT